MIGLDVVFMTCLLANAAGLSVAALVVHHGRARAIGPRLPSFAVGVLLGVVLLDLLPHLWEATGSLLSVLGLFAAALLASWMFDSACACGRRPALHEPRSAGHGHDHAAAAPTRGTALLLLGDFVHSLVDGALIVAALTVGVVPGAVATVAVAIHEVPRRVAIATLLMRCGCRPAWALGLTACAALGTVLGGTLTWWSAEAIRPALPLALALSAAALIFAAATQSARLIGAWRSRVLTRELALPFVAGVLVIGGSHHLLELLG